MKKLNANVFKKSSGKENYMEFISLTKCRQMSAGNKLRLVNVMHFQAGWFEWL
tara:strand:+ start:280 stop:438 length:159 start_codon:yes stop_codon:yes gene_type:complete